MLLDTRRMETCNLIISLDYGSCAALDFQSIDEALGQYNMLQNELGIELIICLGKRAEVLLRNCRNLENFDIHFSQQSESLLQHCIDPILNSQGSSFLGGLYPLPPKKLWDEMLSFHNKLEENGHEEAFYIFGKTFPGPKPALITETGKAHLLRLFRMNNSQLFRDFDWRFAKNVAKDMITKLHDITRGVEGEL